MYLYQLLFCVMMKATYRRRVYLRYDSRGVGRDGQNSGAEGGRYDSYCQKLKSESSHLKPEAGSKESKLEMNQDLNCQSLLPAHIEVMGSYGITIPKSPQLGELIIGRCQEQGVHLPKSTTGAHELGLSFHIKIERVLFSKTFFFQWPEIAST